MAYLLRSPLVPFLGKTRVSFRGQLLAKFFACDVIFITMPRPKKAAKRDSEDVAGSSRSEGRAQSSDKPSQALQNLWLKCIVDFYESETTMSLHSKYVRYGEDCVQKLKNEMWQRFMDVAAAPEWQEENYKSGFDQVLKNKVHDSLWNAKDILTRYGKHHREGDEAFEEVIRRAELFVGQCAPFASTRNREGKITWWQTKEGKVQFMEGSRHLIPLPETAEVIRIDNKVIKGGYATIRRVKIRGCPGIPEYWEFAAKLSNMHATQPHLAKIEHQNESMAVRIGHDGVIHFIAVHARRNEGYAFWWNGRSLWNMLNLDKSYPDNIPMRLAYSSPSEDDVVAAHKLARFRKKRTELAWALLHIMYGVHVARYLHNDISLDNILLHFPMDESCVYIGVCDWGMSTYATEPPKSLYMFQSAREMEDALAKRWWVTPQIAYLHEKHGDVPIIPSLSRASEEYAVCKIAKAINRDCMSEEYYKLNKETQSMSKFEHHTLAIAFQEYLERPCREGSENAGGLAHIINRFTSTFNWPIPNEHFRHLYE